MCFAVPEKEVKAVAEALKSRFRQALDAGRLSQVWSTSDIHILGLTIDFMYKKIYSSLETTLLCLYGRIMVHWIFPWKVIFSILLMIFKAWKVM